MNKNSKYTAIKRDKPSYPLRTLLQQDKILGKVLDFGCGFGSDVNELEKKGFDVTGYDPNYFPKYPTEKFDTIICFYVLNVLLPVEQNKVMMQVSSLLKESGKAFFAVRRDIRVEGYRMHVKHKKETYQCLVHLSQTSVFRNRNTEIYEFIHFTIKHQGEFHKNPFLSGKDYRTPFAESYNFVAFFNKYPQHITDLIATSKNKRSTDASFEENVQQEYYAFKTFCKSELEKLNTDAKISEQEFLPRKGEINIDQWYLNLVCEETN